MVRRDPKSKWAKSAPHGPRNKGLGRCRFGATFALACSELCCRLAIINKGKAEDEEYAELKIEADVDETMAELLQELELAVPPEYCSDLDPVLRQALQVAEGEAAAPWKIGDYLDGAKAENSKMDGAKAEDSDMEDSKAKDSERPNRVYVAWLESK